MEKFLIAGLGNPGQKYQNTRHNIGFRVLDELAQTLSLSFKEENKGAHYLIADLILDNKKVFFIKPLEYMNKSGGPILKIVSYFEIIPEHLLVIHDDLDIEFGKIKITRNGGHGGHNGIRSIIDALNTKKFPRIKVGIGRPPQNMPADRYVLSNFIKNEEEKLKKIIKICAEAAIYFINHGIEATMNKFNGIVK